MGPSSQRVAFITGASSGIGRATAIELAKQGYATFLHAASNEQGLEETCSEVAKVGVDARTCLCDFTNQDLTELAELAWSWQGYVDVLVNNAGADVLTGAAAEWEFEKKLDAVLQVDVVGTLILSRSIGEKMKARFETGDSEGAIINMGWDQAWQGMEGESGELFAAAKGGVMSATLSLAQSLAPAVRVNCVAPGWVKTAWGDQTNDQWDLRAKSSSLSGRWATPEDVAKVIGFLASGDARFINGQIIPVNGGYNFFQDR